MAQTFGGLLKQLRKRGGMTQDDLAAATGYSRSLIGALERNDRLPDVELVAQTFLPALGLQAEPHLATHLVELAALVRGERLPVSPAITRERQRPMPAEAEADIPHLSLPPTGLIGRDQAINHLGHRLLGHQGRLLTLIGPPGVGKTRLAQAVGVELQNVYQDGACFVSLAAISDPELVAVTLATALKVADDAKPPQQRLIEHLRRKALLLILDNFEQLISRPGSSDEPGGGAAVRLVADLLVECPGLHLLVTSRERLHLRAEQRFKVPPLDLASAVELFVQRAQGVEADFQRTSANQSTLEAICQRLDCLPLAIELCAAQVDLLSPRQLLAQLQAHRLTLLTEGSHDLPPRQRTLRTAIDYSYTLLTEAEQMLLRSLGVFVGGFTLDAAAAMVSSRLAALGPEPLAAVQTTLHALLGKSLMQAETTSTGEQRFGLLETIREFALEQMRTHGEEALLRQCHYAFYLQLFRSGDGHLRGPESRAWFARLESEQDNVRTALQWTLDQQRYEDMAWLMMACTWFEAMIGHSYERTRWLLQLLPHRHLLPVDLHLEALTEVFAFGWGIDEFQPLNRWQGEMLQLLEICPNQHLHTTVWYHIAASASDFAEAATAGERGIAAARLACSGPTLGHEFGLLADCDFLLANAVGGYAITLIRWGRFAEALPLLLESQEIFRRRGDQAEIAETLGTLAQVAFMQGDLAGAHKYLAEAITMATTFNYQGRMADLQPLLGLVTLYQGRVSEAQQILNTSLRLCLELKNKQFVARSYNYLAEAALWEGQLDQARQALRDSQVYAMETGKVTIDDLERLWIAARLATAEGQYQRAATLFGLAETIHSNHRYAVAGPVRALADTALATVRRELGDEHFAQAFAAGQKLSPTEVFATFDTHLR